MKYFPFSNGMKKGNKTTKSMKENKKNKELLYTIMRSKMSKSASRHEDRLVAFRKAVRLFCLPFI